MLRGGRWVKSIVEMGLLKNWVLSSEFAFGNAKVRVKPSWDLESGDFALLLRQPWDIRELYSLNKRLWFSCQLARRKKGF
jgi:hypothetical protein